MLKRKLPKDWITVNSKSHPDRVYYFNVKTNKSSWIQPTLDEASKTSLVNECKIHEEEVHRSAMTPERNVEKKEISNRRRSYDKILDTPQMKALKAKVLQRLEARNKSSPSSLEVSYARTVETKRRSFPPRNSFSKLRDDTSVTSRDKNDNEVTFTPQIGLSDGIDVVDHSRNVEAREAETTEMKISCVQDMISSLQKPESFGKTASPIDEGRDSKYPDEWLTDQNRSLRYFDPPKMSEICQVSPICELATSPVRREPFFLNEELHRSAFDTIEGSCRNGAVIRESDRSDQSRLMFGRSLSNESEPYDDPYESKELRAAHSDVTNKLIRTISEESLPREMLEGVDEEMVDFFDEKLAKDATNKLKKDCQDQLVKTPPPSPEPKIKAQILDNDHSALLKVLNDEAADGSNLSSMTPSLTELEAALSDMLEKEDQPDEIMKRENASEECKSTPVEKLLEPEIIPVEKRNAIDRSVSDQCRSINDDILVDGMPENKTDRLSLEQLHGDSTSTSKKRKVSFCSWEEKVMLDVDLKNDEASPRNKVPENLDEATTPNLKDSVVKSELGSSSDFFESVAGDTKDSASSVGETSEKPTRLIQNLEDVTEDLLEQIPTPPRRKNKSLGITKESVRSIDNYHENPDSGPNDRLI
ncbi:uncharacterized protein LOC112453459 [Temnothorax curvispinosus]|uniref:Uncharacterized protein LOC112453459 n=1 Tax=Temnothorax curvispinosus TaxID=300111 RepID=A0A6J1PKW7_9HYME|nr:uncharacterized protein LOC112453459 [Temnothorax curvispinosus]